MNAEQMKKWTCSYCGHDAKTTHTHQTPIPLLRNEVCMKCGVSADYDGAPCAHEYKTATNFYMED